MAHPLGAVVVVVEAELTTPQRPTAVSKGAETVAVAVKMERMAEAVKVERQAEVVLVERQAEAEQVERQAEAEQVERQAEVEQVERQAEAVKVVLLVQAVAVAVKILNCLMCLIPLLVMVTASQTGAVLNLMAISVVLGHLQRSALGAHVLKI